MKAHKKDIKVCFVGGGSMGHIAPNIAVLEELKKESKKKKINLDVFYIGRRNNFERGLVEREGVRYFGIFTGKFRRYFDLRHFSDPFLIVLGLLESVFILIFNRPDLVFLKGGYVTVPVALAAKILRINMIAHESDIVPGAANMIAQKLGARMALGFPEEMYKESFTGNSFFAGNPLRGDIVNFKGSKKDLKTIYGLDISVPIILVMGGSQGAKKINDLIDDMISSLTSRYSVLHITGKSHIDYFLAKKSGMNEERSSRYLPFGFVEENIALLMASCDMVISRAGVGALTEIMHFKKPSIIIPISKAGSHQVVNAIFMRDHKIASIMDEDILTPKKLISEIDFVIKDQTIKRNISRKAEKLFPSGSARNIALEILRMCDF